RYLSIDGEVVVDVPMPLGVAQALVSVHGLTGVPEGYDVFEQWLRVVAEPPLLWRSRNTYLGGVGKYPALGLGAVGDSIGVPARDEVLVRVGPVITVSLTHHLQAIGVAAIAVASRDSLGLSSSDFGQIGLRYRW